MFWAIEIKLRAERRGGELLAEMDRARAGDNQWSSYDTTTLSDLNISKDQSSHWQKEASVPEEEFEAMAGGGGDLLFGILGKFSPVFFRALNISFCRVDDPRAQVRLVPPA